MEVMHSVQNIEVSVSDVFKGILSRYFTCDSKKNRKGDLVLTMSARNLQKPSQPRIVTVQINRDHLDNHDYTKAMVESGVRKLIY